MRIAAFNLNRNRKENIARSIFLKYERETKELLAAGYNPAPLNADRVESILHGEFIVAIYPFVTDGFTTKQINEIVKWVKAEAKYHVTFEMLDIPAEYIQL